jgi:hypothetical protein
MSADDLPGTYELVSVEHFADEGVRYPFGPNPKGYMVFTTTGHMVTILMDGDRPNITTGDLLAGDVATASDAELAAAFNSAMAFGGRYELHGEAVHIHLEVGTYPNWAGTTQVRPFELADGDLSLYPPGWRVRFRRVEEA